MQYNKELAAIIKTSAWQILKCKAESFLLKQLENGNDTFLNARREEKLMVKSEAESWQWDLDH